MTVRELIEILQQKNPDAVVMVAGDELPDHPASEVVVGFHDPAKTALWEKSFYDPTFTRRPIPAPAFIPAVRIG